MRTSSKRENVFQNLKSMILALLLLSMPFLANAEMYKNIGPLDTFAEVKAKFPNANYERVNAAWTSEADVLYKITGEGMSGVIVVNFYDGRPVYKKYLEQNNLNSEESRLWTILINQTDEKALSVGWVRWVPDQQIPLSRLTSKYGNPDKKGFDDEDLQPYREWVDKGLVAFLTDDEKYIARIDYVFTKGEQRKAWIAKHGSIPAWLKEPPQKKKKKKL